MRRVSLEDYWASGRECGAGVVPEHAEGEGEVACAEDGDRAQRPVDPHEPGRGAVRAVERASEVRTLGGDVAIEAELFGRAGYLGPQACLTQRGLDLRQFDQLRGVASRASATRQPLPPLPRARPWPWRRYRQTRARDNPYLGGDLSSTALFASPVRGLCEVTLTMPP